MPKIIKPKDVMDKWNFYFPRLLKLEMSKKLLDMELQGKQSALLRTLVTMFVNGEINEERVQELIVDEVYVTPGGKQSTL